MTAKQKREAAILKQEKLVNAAKAESRELTAEEKAEFDNLQRDIEALNSEIEAEERSQGQNLHSQNDESERAKKAANAERARCSEITSLCREFHVTPDEYIKNGNTVDEVREAILNTFKDGRGPVEGFRVTADEGDKFRAAASDALLMRSGLNVDKPADGARDLRGMSLRDLGIECLVQQGESASKLLRMSGGEIYDNLIRQFFNPTAAFPSILDNTINKSIVQLYNQVPTTFQAWTTKGSLKDFKETADHEYVIGGAGDFLKVPENGELKADKPRTELLPTRKLDTYGTQFSMSRQAFINDDIGFLTQVPGLYAASAKKTIDKQVYSILFNNSKIFDGKTLFDDKHENIIATGEKPSQAAIQKMILKMQKQKDHFGNAIYMTPRYIVVPVGYEFDLSVILHSAQVTGSANNDINPLYNYPLEIVQTPILNTLAGDKAVPWFMVADPLSARGIQVDYLNGQEMPTIRRMEISGTLGFVWDMWLDWGIAVRDYRGLVKNPGEVITD